MKEFHKPTCVNCNIDMYPSRNGAWVIDMCMDPPEPYKVWACDLWKCRICGNEIASGFSNHGVRREEMNFRTTLEQALKGRHVFNFEYISHAEEYGDDNHLLSGMTALIFQKPLNGADLEGRATLIEKMPWRGDGANFERWMVRFPGDKVSYERTINIEIAELGWG